MSDKLCGLAGLGLDNLEDMDIFGQEKKEEQVAAEAPKIEEKDLIYDKNFTCPVCGEDFPAKIMKTGKARLLGTDQDLRAKYEGIDAVKYDVILCPHCGYAALNRYFNNITKVYAKLIKENISSKVQLHTYDDDIYTYEEAIERYKLCLANAVVKRAHASEMAHERISRISGRIRRYGHGPSPGSEKHGRDLSEECLYRLHGSTSDRRISHVRYG